MKLSSGKKKQSQSNFDGVQLLIEYVMLAELSIAARQIKCHPVRQIKKLATSIGRSGFNVPMLVDENLRIVAGHARFAAAGLLCLEKVPVIRIGHLTSEQLSLFAIFENKVATEGEIDLDAVRLVLDEVSIQVPDIDISDSGFDVAEIDKLRGLHAVQQYDEMDVRVVPKAAPVSRLGDLWHLGRHRLTCGDATDPLLLAQLIGDRRVRALLADPPYNLRIAGSVSGKGAVKHANFQMAVGEMDDAEFRAFLTRFLAAAQPHLLDGALAFVFMDWRHIAELITAARSLGFEYKQLLTWIKSNGALGGLYRNAHELVALLKHGDASHVDNVRLGRYGRNRTNVLHYPGANVPTRGRRRALDTHPTVKPAAMIAELILDVTKPGELVLDSFGGSGTTLMAAEATGRDACLCELEPGYVDATIERFQTRTGIEVVHAATGQTFNRVRDERSNSASTNIAVEEGGR